MMPAVFTQPKSAVRAIALARAISVSGGAAAYMALNLYVYEITGSATALAATMALTFGAAGVVGLFAGMLGDRFDRRKVMIGSDLISGVFFTAMLFAESLGWMIFFAFLSAIAEAPLWAASSAAIPNLVKGNDKDVAWANSVSQMGHNIGILVAPAIVAVLYPVVGARAIFVVNAASFIVSAGLTSMVRGNFAGDRGDADEHVGYLAGARYILKDKVLLWMNLAWFFVVLGIGVVLTAEIPFASLFGESSQYYAWMTGAWGAGSILGAIMGRWVNVKNEGRVLLFGTLVFTAAVGIAAPMTIFFFVPFFIFVSGLADGVGMVAEMHITQRRAPDAVRSRVIAVGQASVALAFAFGFLAAGPILETYGPRWGYGMGAVIGVIASLLLIPAIVELRKADTLARARGEKPIEVKDLAITTALSPDEGSLTRLD